MPETHSAPSRSVSFLQFAPDAPVTKRLSSVFPTLPLPRLGAAVVFALMGVSAAGLLPAHAQTPDSTQLKRFQRADSYIRAGQFEKAIGLLESLYEEAPENPSFYRKLKEAYESVKRYDEALQLVEDRIGDSPTPALLSEKARLLYQKGEEEKADQTWDRTLALAPNRAATYRTVYQTLIDIRRFRKAIEVMTEGREQLDRPNAFRTELAYLYGLDGQHGKAMEEYVALLADSPERVDFVRGRLQTFVEQDQGIEASIEVLQSAVEDAPLNRAYRELLAWLHMEQNDYAAAFDVYRAIDRLEEEQGQVLYQFARQAADAHEYAVATKAFEAILDRHADAAVAPRARKALGDMYRRWASSDAVSSTPGQDSVRYEQAMETYRTFLTTYSGHEAYPEVLLQLGALQLDVRRDLDEAQSTLEQVVSNHSQSPAAERAQYHLGRIALFRDALDRARLLFSRLASEAENDDLADQARYELALLHFYRGEFDAAMTRVKATSANTAADVANDAIELKVLLQENRGPDSLDAALHRFAQARLYERQHRYDDAIASLDTLLQQHGSHPLGDDARFRQAHALLARGDTTAALDAFQAVTEQYPRSPFADRSLFQIGTLHESRGRPAAAVEAYNQLLTDYPKSLLAAETRQRLRTVQRSQG